MVLTCRYSAPWLAIALPLFVSPLLLRAAERSAQPSAKETAARVDPSSVKGLPADTRLPEVIDDEKFLRRVSLDLTGKLPDPDALSRFVADPAADKRPKSVEALLQTDA